MWLKPKKRKRNLPRVWFDEALGLYVTTVRVPLWKTEVTVVIGEYEKFKDYLRKKHKGGDITEGLSQDNDCAQCFYATCGPASPVYHYIWMEEWSHTLDEICTLSHEAIHFACNVIELAGMEIKAGPQSEPLAYLQAYILGEVLYALREHDVNTTKKGIR